MLAFNVILVVCRGNICRSPVAAAMFQQQWPELQVQSAGLAAVVGQSIDATARQFAEADGLKVSQHRAQQLDANLLVQADLVLVMSDGQRREIGFHWPEAMGKTFRLGHWLDEGNGKDIPDPYCKSTETFEYVHRLIALSTRAWSAII